MPFTNLWNLPETGIANLSMDDRFTMANMAIEAGAKNGIFPVDDKTIQYLNEHTKKEYTVYEADEDAEYEQVVEIDLAEVRQPLHSHIFLETQKRSMRSRLWSRSRSIRLLLDPVRMDVWKT